MIVKMDTDNVRAMAAKMRSSAESFQQHIDSIHHSVVSAGWQSQAREEFILQLEMMRTGVQQTEDALKMMATAADRKSEQWESIASVFNGPFLYLRGIWDSVRNLIGNFWSGMLEKFSNIRLPTLPYWIKPIPGSVLPGLIPTLPFLPNWKEKFENWWPPNKKGPDGGSNGNKNEDGGGNEPANGSQPSKPVDTAPKDYPQPPNKPKLKKVSGKPSSYTCATYAKARRPDLGSTQSNNEHWKDGAAANYIGKFENKAFQLENSESNLTDSIGPGYAVVWEPSHPSANSTYGHVAIVESVYADHVVISEASRVNKVYQIRERSIPIEQFYDDQVWLIP
jgi:surface antigen/uncharacterized protein YukE